MEVIKARVYSGKRAAHVHNMRKCVTAGQTAGCVYAQEMIGVADMHAVFENSKMHMHVTKLLNEMQFKRSVYSTFCGLACSAEMKWSLHCPITCCSYMLQLQWHEMSPFFGHLTCRNVLLKIGRMLKLEQWPQCIVISFAMTNTRSLLMPHGLSSIPLQLPPDQHEPHSILTAEANARHVDRGSRRMAGKVQCILHVQIKCSPQALSLARRVGSCRKS